MRIYLAGKMDCLGDWRDHLLEPRAEKGKHLWHCEGNEAAIWDDWVTSLVDAEPSPIVWPTAPNRLVLGTHQYVGPYRSLLPDARGEHTGYLHGNEGRGQHGWLDNDDDRARIALYCYKRVEVADMVFAYLNSFDSFGALVEIGLAAARNKWLVIVQGDGAVGPYDEELWFAGALAHRYERFPGRCDSDTVAPTPAEEGAFLRGVLLEEISKWAAWKEKAATRPDFRATVSQSFQQVLRWTSDPRVRDEARRMIRLLEGAA